MLHAFPKIFTLGESYIKDIFQEEVEISEKIDGSQFVFGKIKGEIHMRSKGQALYFDNPEKMFSVAISYVDSIRELIPDNMAFYCEYLRTPKHNVLQYERVPKNNLMMFGAYDFNSRVFFKTEDLANMLGIESVPILYRGKVDPNNILVTLDTDSVLGGQKIEGFVVKNYYRPFLLGGQPIPLMSGKLVSEAFKEKHKSNWKSENTGKGKWDVFKGSYRTEARWHKAIQHLRDNGLLEHSPRDIGILLREVKRDIEDEEKENIKEFLYKEFGEELLRVAIAGFPEFYKKYLVESTYGEDK